MYINLYATTLQVSQLFATKRKAIYTTAYNIHHKRLAFRIRLHREVKIPRCFSSRYNSMFRVGDDSPNVWGEVNLEASSSSDKDTTHSISGNLGMRTRM
jgi:hypothetical protein